MNNILYVAILIWYWINILTLKIICILTILNLKNTPLLKNIETLDMRYPFRELNPYLRRNTWKKPNPLKLARLDMFLLSNNLMPFVLKVVIENRYMSNHSGAVLYMELKK